MFFDIAANEVETGRTDRSKITAERYGRRLAFPEKESLGLNN